MTQTTKMLINIYDYLVIFIRKFINKNTKHSLIKTDDNYTKETVYPAHFTHKCLEAIKQAPNTSTEASLTTPNLRKGSNLNKPKPETLIASGEQKTSKAQKALIDWISSFNHNHFLTIQFPDNMKTSNSYASRDYLRRTMANFELNLLGKHWKKKRIFFMVFAEKGKSDSWHYHILFNAGNFTTEKLQTALDKTTKFMKFYDYNLYLEPIKKDGVYSYCVKEIRIQNNGNISSDHIILSDDLFGIDDKTPSIAP